MDRNQFIVERTRAIFGERLDDVLHMVRQDRQGMRGWEEPAHVRAVLRRSAREASPTGYTDSTSETSLAVMEFARSAGEPDRGQQREGVGQLLETGASALEKVARQTQPALTNEERLGLECTLLLYGRPAVELRDNRLAHVSPFWNLLEDQREDIEMAQRGVGRIELFGHPEYDWAGTGCLVNETTLLTTRRTAELFIEYRNNTWSFRPGITAWMNYSSDNKRVPNAGYRVRNIIGVHEHYDLAMLEVEPPQSQNGSTPTPLAVAAQPPANLVGRPAYLISYPILDARRNEPEAITRVFRDVYNVKRVQPGIVRSVFPFREVQLLQHDCGMLGQSTGGCVMDLETHQVLGLQLYSRYLETSTAIPLWVLRDDPFMQRAGVTFAQVSREDLDTSACQLERLARSRYWTEARATLQALYQRAYGAK